MNVELQRSSGVLNRGSLTMLPGDECPELVEDVLEEGLGTACSFNRWGTLLAVGCHDGRVVVWDFDTRSVARSFAAHTHAITALSWSRDGARLATASADWTASVWDVAGGYVVAVASFDTPVWLAQMHPRDNDVVLVWPLYDVPVLLRLGEKKEGVGQCSVETTPLPYVDDNVSSSVSTSSTKRQRVTACGFAASFTPDGNHIFLGNSHGVLTVVRLDGLVVERSEKICSSAIKSIEFTNDGNFFLANCADKTVRYCETASPTHPRDFVDPVEKVQWKKCGFSPSGELIIAGSASKSQHNLYIWNKHGLMYKVLEGPMEGIMDLAWHPAKPIIVSCSTSGVLYVWGRTYAENWSAFAPGFVELGENVEYVEREDEFDISKEDVEPPPQFGANTSMEARTAAKRAAERTKILELHGSELVDVTTVERTEDDDPRYVKHLPIIPDPDVFLS